MSAVKDAPALGRPSLTRNRTIRAEFMPMRSPQQWFPRDANLGRQFQDDISTKRFHSNCQCLEVTMLMMPPHQCGRAGAEYGPGSRQ